MKIQPITIMKSRYVHLKLFTVLAAAVLAIPSPAEILPDGTDATFVYNMMLGTYTLAKPVEFNTPLGKMELKTVSFHKNGKIRDCVLDKPQVIETPAGKMHKLSEISFYESGKIRIVDLAENAIIEGKGFSKGDSIGWDDKGKFLGKMKWDNKNGMYVQNQDTDN